MIQLYYWPTPNGWKISILLEELGLPYDLKPVNIVAGDQFKPDFLKRSPNNRMPAIVDPDGPDGAEISIFESGAIMQYLARKHHRFYGGTQRDSIVIDQWLMWQMGGIGPMAGQCHHFLKYAPEMDPPQVLPYAQDRYRAEVGRLYRVLNQQLEGQDYVCGDYSIADMAIFPWVRLWEGQQQDLSDKPNVVAWLERVNARDAVQRGLALYADQRGALRDKNAQANLFKTR